MAISWSGTAWVASTAYTVGLRVVNVGNVYQCTTAGTSAASGGPTGTSSAITDGTVTWSYLGANGGAVVDVDATLSTVPSASQIFFLRLAGTLVADVTVWGDLLDFGQCYLAAHFGELWILRGHGPITSETVGALSRSYTSLIGDFSVDLTPAGRMYMDLIRTLPTGLGYVVGQ